MEHSNRISIKSPVALLAFVLASVVAGSIGSLVTITGPASWYSLLVKPVFQPPNWIFGPMWTLLFILMGIAAYLIWERGIKEPEVRFALSVFCIQFVFNILWSFLFFGMQSPLLGLLDIIILWWLILATIMTFYRVRKSAAYFLIPYIAWVSFATILNATIVLLNP
ncbi:TspO/MBR family protein [Methanoregula sp.]|uniref:TspO/MBR family protein n=1 Tax=Methanoregula sp. TaxID=2052170 RepID=UPI000CAEBE90|nr:TspO/MBR family protein [Methanoregula sp.]PKG32473.1 MAG: TspO protein [Methanoregula sp.]